MRFSVALTLVGFLLASGVARAQAGVDPKTLLTSGYTLDAAVTGDVFGDGSQAIAVLSHAAESDGTLPVGRADLFSCDGAGDICELVVSVPLPPFDAGGLFMTRLMGDSRQQLVIYTVAGSGGFLSYQVLGSDGAQIVQLLERDGIFQGRVEVRANGLLEHTTDRSWLYSWNGSEFVGAQVNVSPPVPIGTAKVHYSVTPTSVVGPRQVTIKVGQRLELVRDDARAENTRILYGSDILTVDKWPVLSATKAGTTTIDIIPRGYDWENELKVTVNVEP